MNQAQFNAGLLAFLDQSPTPFHATENLTGALNSAGFERLEERAAWQLQSGGRYWITRNGSSMIAFSLGSVPLADAGFRMV